MESKDWSGFGYLSSDFSMLNDNTRHEASYCSSYQTQMGLHMESCWVLPYGQN